jgi:lipoic acid synthetase
MEKISENKGLERPHVRQPKPAWIKMRPPSGPSYVKIKGMLKNLNIATVCQEAMCPNLSECWGGGTATFMIMGDTCTRGCRFCSVKTAKLPAALDPKEPENVSYALSQMDLKYVVLTSVDRDELADGGAAHFAKTIDLIHLTSPKLLVEVLTPDFSGETSQIDKLIKAKPDVYAQNIETVKRLTKKVRDPRAGYEQTMNVLKYVKEKAPKMITKTSIMLGLGETDTEVLETLKDLRSVGCDVVTFGQYLQPTRKQLPVEKFYKPAEFDVWKKTAEDLGFFYVASGPMVRSSYKAGEYFMQGMIKRMRNEEQQKLSK